MPVVGIDLARADCAFAHLNQTLAARSTFETTTSRASGLNEIAEPTRGRPTDDAFEWPFGAEV